MTPIQFIRILWARRWIALAVFMAVSAAGLTYALRQPRQFNAEALLVLDFRPDPILGGLSSAASMTTQLEIIKTDKVGGRVVELLGLEKNEDTISQWRRATAGKIPLTTYMSGQLQRGLSVEALRGSNIINISFSADNADFAIAAANAFAKAAADVSIELRVGPTRESADWFGDQTKLLRANLEQAQAKLSEFQRESGIVVSDERMSQEIARLNALETALVGAQTERLDASGRQRSASKDVLPDGQPSQQVQSLQAQLGLAQTRLAEVSGVLGSGHPQRVQLEAQIAGLKQLLAAETQRVAISTVVASKISAQKVDELRSMLESQKRQVLSLRSQRDQISVLLRDIETAQHAYDAASQRAGQLSLESQNNQTAVRLLSPANEAAEISQKKLLIRILGSLAAGLALGAGVAIGLELLDRRVRGLEDLLEMPGVPVLGVLGAPLGQGVSLPRLTGPDVAGSR